MSFILPVRSTTLRPKPTRSMSSTHSHSPTQAPLPVISEDEDGYIGPRPPPVPPRALNRPTARNQLFGAPPRHNYEKSPPPYSNFNNDRMIGPNGEKLSDLRRGITADIRNNKFVAKRGGWNRLAIVAAVLICIIVGLVVGLVVGLKDRNHGNSSNQNSSSGGASGTISGPGTSNATFPAGSYRINSYLFTISTNCTSNPATWTCYPYTIYSQSATASAATFDWVISPSSSSTSDTNYTISSQPNYFSILFTNATLYLRNPNQANEHYFFKTTLQKPTKPTTQLGSQNVASTCYFNQTVLQGYLYTKMAATYGSSSNGTDTSAYKPWPYAVKVEQTAAAGAQTPTCVGPDGQVLGDFSIADLNQSCGCGYGNTGG